MFFVKGNGSNEVCGQVSDFLSRDNFTLEIIPYPLKAFEGEVITVKDSGKSDFELYSKKEKLTPKPEPFMERPAESCMYIVIDYTEQQQEYIVDFIVDKLKQSNFEPNDLRVIREFPPSLLEKIEEKYHERTNEGK